MITKLCEMAAAYHTDKAGWYTPFYSLLFEPYRESFRKVLEVGIGTPEAMAHVPGYQPGASLFMWREYFPKAIIYAVDVDPSIDVDSEFHILAFNSDSRDPDLRERLSEQALPFDLIVDDGDHDPAVQFATFLNLFPLVRDGGFYIIEDAESYLELSDKLEGYTHQIVLCPFAGSMGKLIVIRK